MAEVKKRKVGVRTIVILVAGAVAVFVGSILLYLHAWGMLSFQSPYLRPGPGYAVVDSTYGSGDELLGEPSHEEPDDLGAAPAGREEVTPPVSADSLAVSDPTALSAAEGTPPEDVLDAGALPEGPDGSGEGEVGEAPEDSLGAGAWVSADSSAGDLTPLLPFEPSKLGRLVRVYEKMRPKQVALILSTMPEKQAVLILSNMKDKQTAAVLAEMDPGKAARISQLLMLWGQSEQ